MKIIIAGLLLLLLLTVSTGVFAQSDAYSTVQSVPITVALTDKDSVIVYFLYPTLSDFWYADSVLPTSSMGAIRRRDRTNVSSGAVRVWIEQNLSTGQIASEVDSFSLRVYPFTWDADDTEYVVDTHDYFYVKFGVVGDYYSTDYYFSDLTPTEEYSACLGGALWGDQGFAIELVQHVISAQSGRGLYRLWLEAGQYRGRKH